MLLYSLVISMHIKLLSIQQRGIYTRTSPGIGH
jgi:hypothetical protein